MNPTPLRRTSRSRRTPAEEEERRNAAALIEELMIKQGRKWKWLADCVVPDGGMTLSRLRNILRGAPRYHFKPGEQARLADALGVEVWHLWPSLRPWTHISISENEGEGEGEANNDNLS